LQFNVVIDPKEAVPVIAKPGRRQAQTNQQRRLTHSNSHSKSPGAAAPFISIRAP